MNSTEDHFLNLVQKHLTGSLSGEEEQELQKLLSLNTAYKQVLDRYVQLWVKAGNLFPAQPVNIDAAKQRFWQTVENGHFTEKYANKSRKTLLNHSWFKIAAAILLLVCLGGLWLVNSPTNSFFTDSIIYKADGETVAFMLPDSSQVWLNKGSQLSFSEGFNEKDRKVFLQGEAFFEVKRNRNKPFIVQSEQASVQVLGTSFNVKAYEADSLVKVFVATGKVAFASLESQEALVLTPQTAAVFNKETENLIKTAVIDPNTLAWKTGILVFQNMSLPKVLNDLADHYNVTFKYNVTVFENCTITSTYNNESLDEVLKELSLLVNLKVEKSGEGVYQLKGNGCE